MNARIKTRIRKTIAEHLTIQAKRFFLERGIEYQNIPERRWSAVRAGLESGQTPAEATAKPIHDPIGALDDMSDDDLYKLFDVAGLTVREIYCDQVALLGLVGPSKKDIVTAKKTPRCLLRQVVEFMEFGDDYSTSLERAKHALKK